MTEITNLPRIHDERHLELLQGIAKASQQVEWASDTLRRIAGQDKSYRSRSVYTWVVSRKDRTPASIGDAIAAVQAMVDAGDTHVPM